jgi:hypothetical protein
LVKDLLCATVGKDCLVLIPLGIHELAYVGH